MEEIAAKAKGRAVQVVSVNKDHTFSLNVEGLKRILMQDDVKDRQVVVVSVAGAFRKGKSFMLNFFIRFLQSKVCRFI